MLFPAAEIPNVTLGEMGEDGNATSYFMECVKYLHNHVFTFE